MHKLITAIMVIPAVLVGVLVILFWGWIAYLTYQSESYGLLAFEFLLLWPLAAGIYFDVGK